MEEIPFSGWQFCNQRSTGQNGLPSFMLARTRRRDFQVPQLARAHAFTTSHRELIEFYLFRKSRRSLFYNFSEAVSWKYDFPETRLFLDLFQNTF
jgi:hypothetical protein